MRLFDSPQLECRSLYDSKLSLGGRQILQVHVHGWGWLSLNTEKAKFRSYFWGEKRWNLLIPQTSSAKVEATNFFGVRSKALVVRKEETLKPDEEFLQSIQPEYSKFAKASPNRLMRIGLEAINLQVKHAVRMIPFIGLQFFSRPNSIKLIGFNRLSHPLYVKIPQFNLEFPGSKISSLLRYLK